MALSFEGAVANQDEYRPTSQETVRTLSTITLAPHVGPTAVGKNYMMAHLVKNHGYHLVGNITTRELRLNDPDNIRHRDEDEVLEAIEQGRLVQYAAHLGSRALYGTMVKDYQAGQINIKDIYAHTVENFTRYGFRHIRPVCIVAPAEKWEARLDRRVAEMTTEQIGGRLDEAAESIEWMLDGSPQISRVMVISDDDHAQENTERIQAFVENGMHVEPEQLHIDTAERMLSSLPAMRIKYLGRG